MSRTSGLLSVRYFLIPSLFVCLFLVTEPMAAQSSYVEGVSAILSSTSATEIDTWSETYVSPDLAYYYGAYVEGYLFENGTLIDSGYADRYPYENDAYGGLSDPLVLGDVYRIESDHYVVEYYIYGYDQYGNTLYSNPAYFLVSTQGSPPDPSGWNFTPGGGPEYYDIEYLYLGSTGVEISSAAPYISDMSPSSASRGTSGSVTITGDDLVDIFTGETTPAITGSGVSISVQSQSSTEVILNYTVATDAGTGAHSITLSTRFGTSNAASLNVGDPTPNIISVEPNSWNAGTTTTFSITGTGFGTNPTLTISGSGITGSSISSASNTRIQASVTVDASAPAETATVTVTSNGYGGTGFVDTNPGQSNNNSYYVNIQPIAAPVPQISFFGTVINAPQNVFVGQQIALTASVTVPSGLAIASQSWTFPGTAIANLNASAEAGEQVTQLVSFNNASLTFYWLSAGSSGEIQYTLAYDYCLVNNQCNSANATFNLAGPSGTTANVTTTSVNVFHNSILGDLMAFQTVNPDQPGIKFVAQATLPAANQGSYQWLQLLNSDQTHYITSTGQYPCSSFNGPAGSAELDTSYPYGNVTPSTVSTTNVPSDTAKDSPNSGLPSMYGAAQRSFNATMFLRWVPAADSRCTAGSACTIPVPLGSLSWSYTGSSINTLQPQSNGTTWSLSCSTNSQGPQVAFSPSDLAVANNFGYPNWQYVATSGCH